MIKIAISGQAKTGKNTLANYITECIDNDQIGCKIVAVADPIKNMIMQMVPNANRECLWGASELRSHHLPGNLKNATGGQLTYRQALIDFGTLGRKYNPDVWLNALVQDANNSKVLQAYIVSDCRFINEITYLKEHGFFMVRIKRNNIPQIDDVSETAQLEIPDSYFDLVINNNGPASDLYDHAKSIIHKLV